MRLYRLWLVAVSAAVLLIKGCEIALFLREEIDDNQSKQWPQNGLKSHLSRWEADMERLPQPNNAPLSSSNATSTFRDAAIESKEEEEGSRVKDLSEGKDEASTRLDNEVAAKPTESAPAQLATETKISSETEAIVVKTAPRRKWAYAFLMAGCNPEDPGGYMGFFFTIIISAHLLRQSQTAADIVLMVQMSSQTKQEILTEENLRLLKLLDIKVQYIPKPTGKESFYSVTLEKIRVLQLVEYSRVLFLDADVMPFCSLDYVFQLSEPENETERPLLKENVMIAGFHSPMNAGFFMVNPQPGDMDDIREIVKHQYSGKETYSFDPVIGWGHQIKPPDRWRDFWGRSGLQWTFNGAIADQGLLMHWMKYVKRSVSAVNKGIIQHWAAVKNTSDQVEIESETKEPFEGYSCVPEEVTNLPWYSNHSMVHLGQLPYRDFVHYTGGSKPWRGIHTPPQPIEALNETVSPIQFWHYQLGIIKKKLGMTYLNLTDLLLGQTSVGSQFRKKDIMSVAKTRDVLLSAME